MSELNQAEVIKTWWPMAGFTPPFMPGEVSGNNDGCVRDSEGRVVADCNGCESAADVIAALLNREAERRAVDVGTLVRRVATPQ